jgi:phosphoenolpyruvate carboxylase
MVINEKGFQKISTDRKFVIACYAEMLTRINENEVAALINSTLVEGKIEENDLSSEKIIQSLSIYFQLMTLVEENAATQYRRKLEDQEKITAIRGSWGEALHHWKNSNITEDEMLSAISKTEVIPVLTAHPTEAKRLL